MLTSSPTELSRFAAACALASLVVAAGGASAQDMLTTVVPKVNASGTSTLGPFGYDPTGPNGGTIYAAGFGSGGELRRIENVSGTQTVTTMVTQTPWSLFLKGGDPNNTGGSPVPSGLLLNPLPVGGQPAYSFAIVSDGGTQIQVAGTRRNDLTQRLYAYNLGSGTSTLTSVATQAAFATAAGLANSGTVGGINVSRQFAYSGNGQSLYIADSSAANVSGGVYRVNLQTNAVTRLLADTDCNIEVAVLSSGGTDTIFLRGGGSTANAGGIDKITFDGTTASARTVHVSAATLADFMETTVNDISMPSLASTPNGTLYFTNSDSNPERRGMYRLDASGRMSKVVSQAERVAAFGGSPNSNILRMQPRTVTHPNGFDVTQILYAESSPLSLIAGAYDFLPGDFNRDNVVDAADLAQFAAAVGPRGVAASSTAALRFDLNGNSAVDWKDVKILQSFVPGLRDGDANMDLAVNFADLDLMGDNYYTVTTGSSVATWTKGDFASLDPLATTYSGTATDANVVNLADLQVIADTWLRVLGQPAPTTQDLDTRGYTGQFRLDVITAFAVVPEPSTLVAGIAGGLVGLLLLRRRR